MPKDQIETNSGCEAASTAGDSKVQSTTTEGSGGSSSGPDLAATTVAYADLPTTERRERILRDLMRPSLLKSGVALLLRSDAERDEAIREIVGLQADKLAEISEEGVQLRGPLVLSFANSSVFTGRLKASLACVGQPMFPVEIRIPWRYWARAIAILRDAGLATERESGTLDGLAVIEALERHYPYLVAEIRSAHIELWRVAHIAGLHSGALDRLQLLMTHDVLADWAAGGFAAIFAQPFFFAARPDRRRRLIESHRPRLLIHDALPAEKRKAVLAFSPTRLLLGSETPD